MPGSETRPQLPLLAKLAAQALTERPALNVEEMAEAIGVKPARAATALAYLVGTGLADEIRPGVFARHRGKVQRHRRKCPACGWHRRGDKYDPRWSECIVCHAMQRKH